MKDDDRPNQQGRTRRSPEWVPFALVALVIIPAIAGSLRLVELFGGPHLMPANPRASASPAPIVVHIICALSYAVLGAFQFSAALRRRRPGWHRVAGRVLVALGLAVAISALWMTQFYPRQPGTGELTYLFRLGFGAGMATSVLIGFAAIRHGDVTRHRAWMTRAYALALGAGTQVFTQGLGAPIFGTGETANALLLGAGWVINLAVAEYVIRRPGGRRWPPRSGWLHNQRSIPQASRSQVMGDLRVSAYFRWKYFPPSAIWAAIVDAEVSPSWASRALRMRSWEARTATRRFSG